MTFLQPLMLLALPLAAMPIIIHLIHLYRRRKVKWAAMIFLAAAQRMNKGFSRLRQVLILALRVLALIALILVVTRPLAGGWLGLTGGAPDTVIILLDRSASMSQKNTATGLSKLTGGLQNVSKAISDAVGTRSHLVLIDSALGKPLPLDKASALLTIPQTEATDTAADIPGLLQNALDYIVSNKTGRTDVWLLSDLQQSDWDSGSGRWQTLRGAFASMQGVRFHLLCYPQTAPDDLGVIIDRVTRLETAEKAEVLLDLRIVRHSANPQPLKLPLSFVVNGTATTTTVDLKENQLVLQGYSIPIDKSLKHGWGHVDLPADSCPENDKYYFVFDEMPPLHSVIVSDDDAQSGPLNAALSAPSDSSRSYVTTVLASSHAAEIPWDDTALIVWNAPIPKTNDVLANQLRKFATNGRTILFLPPDSPDDTKIFELGWGRWQEATAGKALTVDWWRNDDDLLANTRDGSTLPIGTLEISRLCGIEGDGIPLARVSGHAPLLMRSLDRNGNVYFLGTLPGPGSSSLARDGVVMFALLERALNQGAATLGKAQQRFASSAVLGNDPGKWRPVDPQTETAIPENLPLHAGIFSSGERLVALNRPPGEDQPQALSSTEVDDLFAGLDFRVLSDTLENGRSLTNEVWRTFLMLVALALISEALLCMPPRRDLAGNATAFVSSSSPATADGYRKMKPASQSLVFVWTPASLIGAILLVAVVGGLAWMAWQRSSFRPIVGWLEGLRVLIAVGIGITLNQPEWREIYKPESKPVLAVLVDVSHSMQTQDVFDSANLAAEPKARADLAKPFVNMDAWHELTQKMDVVVEPFSSAEQPPEEGTDIGAALAHAAEQHPHLRAVVLVSDGDWNAGDSPANAAMKLRMREVPVFAVPVGAESHLPDVELSSFDVPAFAVAGKPLRIPFTIESTLPRDEAATLEMKSSTGEVITKSVTIPAMSKLEDVITWKPESPGEIKLTLTVPKTGDERNLDNNSIEAPLSVRKEQLRVLVIDSYPRWEYRYLRNALERDPGVEVNCLLFHPDLGKVGAGRGYLSDFPKDDALAKYDVVFLGDVGVDTKQLSSEQCEALQKLVRDQAAGLVFMPGFHGYELSLQQSALAELIPIVWDEGQPQGFGTSTPGNFSLTEAGEQSLLTKLEDTDEANEQVWKNLPGFQWYAPALRAKAGTEVLATHSTESNSFGRVPLIVTRTYGAGKILFMGTDGAWRWRKGVEDRYHYRFWGQVVRWMAYQRNMSQGDEMRLFYSPDRPKAGAVLTLNANVMSKSGEPLRDGAVIAQITAPSGKIDSVRLSPAGEQAWGLFNGVFTPEEPGQYLVRLSSADAGTALDTTISVQGSAREKIGKPAKPEVLREIAQLTRGKFMENATPASLATIIATLPQPELQERRIQLWAHPLWSGLLILLLGLFWAGRKYAGTF